jgi:molybdenum cofactor cytidylyltransferase
VFGARLDADDLAEDAAAAAVAAALQGEGIVARRAYTGRCNLHATRRGLVTVDARIIDRINAIDEAVTVATLAPLSAVRAGAVVATVKDHSAGGGRHRHRSSASARRGRARRSACFPSPRSARADRYRAAGRPGKELRHRRDQQPPPHRGPRQPSRPGAALRPSREEVARALRESLAAGCDLLMISGATVPKDRADTIPSAIVAAGGEIIHFGMPVEPGNMLLLARIGEVPVLILPGCARSRRTNGLDWVLQRMLAGLPMGSSEIKAMGVGGLIRSAPEAEEDPDAVEPAPPRVAVRAAALPRWCWRRAAAGAWPAATSCCSRWPGCPWCAARRTRRWPRAHCRGRRHRLRRRCRAGALPGWTSSSRTIRSMKAAWPRRCAPASRALPADTDAVVVVLGDMPNGQRRPHRPPDRRLRSGARQHRGADEGRPARQSHPLAARLCSTRCGRCRAMSARAGCCSFMRIASTRCPATTMRFLPTSIRRRRCARTGAAMSEVRFRPARRISAAGGQPRPALPGQRGDGADPPLRARRGDAPRNRQPRQRAARQPPPRRGGGPGLRCGAGERGALPQCASADEIVFTSGATAALNLVAHAFGATLRPGDRVLVSQAEHHSNFVPWQMLRDRAGIALDLLPVTASGELDLAALPRLLTPRTRLVAVTQCSNVTGAWTDVAAVVAAARAVGARVLLDGAQAVQHGPQDVQALGVDFLRLLRPQGLRAERHRRALGARRGACRPAALPRRRRHDR